MTVVVREVGLGPAVRVSRDLLEPLAPIDAGGKHFEVDLSTRPKPRAKGPSKAYKQHRLPSGIVRQTMSVWDLLLPLLQPPVRLDECRALPHRLYRYQVEGIEFLRGSESALLADEMGTGKTVMSVVALRLLIRAGVVGRAVIVCPLSLLGVWERHLAEWAPELAVTVVHGDARTRWADWRCPAHVWVTTYDTLRADSLATPRSGGVLLPADLAERFDLALLDEAQNIKNPNSGRSQAVRKLQPRFRWALSGTPIENRLDDLVSLFKFVRPRLLAPEGLTPRAASALIAPYVKRRTKAEVMRELPPKIRQDVWLPLDADQLKAYRAAEDGGRRELAELGEKVSRVHIFTLITKLKMICNFAPGRTESPKLAAVASRVEELAANGNKTLIFSQWVGEGVDKLARALAPYGVVAFDARLDAARRERAVKQFQEDPKATVFVATVKSAGVGLTLTEASYVFHFDHWWNPAWMWQAEDRAHRRGQTRPVNVYSLWMSGTIEERIHDVLQKKGVLHDTVVGGLAESAIDGMITVDEWLGLLGV